MGFYHGLLLASICLMFHAAYSAAEWRSYARKSFSESESGQNSMPLDIVLETVAGLLLAMFAVLKIGGPFKEIRASVELSQKNWENVRNRQSYYVYSHRGKAFSPDYVPPQPPPPASRQSPVEIPERFLS